MTEKIDTEKTMAKGRSLLDREAADQANHLAAVAPENGLILESEIPDTRGVRTSTTVNQIWLIPE